jgi:MSHA pilin protein MshD
MIHMTTSQRGMTLIEVVIAIVVVATSVSAILGLLSSNIGRSADAMITAQAVAVAESYLEEITLKPFVDPDGTDGEAVRANFDDADDYNGLLDVGAIDQFGVPVPGLSAYTISVGVVPSAALPGIPPADALRIDVRVQRQPTVDYVLSGYKTRL